MKNWRAILAAAMALVVLAVTPAVVLAQSDQSTTPSPRPAAKGALAIEAPRRVGVGEKIDITVYQRGTQEPVKDAGVWAISRENVEAIRAEIATIRQSGDRAAMEAAAEKALNIHAIFLGTTNGAGKVEPQPTLEKAGGYLLVAFKRGYFPGFRPIIVGGRLALAIEAPSRVGVGEKIDITVYQRGTQEPVKDAGVWALSRENVEAIKAEIATIRETGDRAAMEAAAEKALNIHAIFLGTTNGAGKVEPQPTLEKAGGYLLVAFKRGYFPGFRPIIVGGPTLTSVPGGKSLPAQGLGR